MEGYFVTFFTQQNRKHDGIPLANWIIEEAKKQGVGGATLFSGKEGFGHDGRFHSKNYFDLQDPPLQVAMALTFDEYDRLMARFSTNNLRVFFTKSKIEFGFTSES
jgi:PII-like signaling protein